MRPGGPRRNMTTVGARSLFDHRTQMAWTLRVGSHLTIALVGGHRSGRRFGWSAALAAVGVASDVVFRSRSESRPRSPANPLRTTIDGLESGAWTALAAGSTDLARAAQNAHVMPAAFEAGFRLGAGVDAVPVVAPPRPFPPTTADLTAIVHDAAGVMAPLAASRLVQRWRGRPAPNFEYVWPAFGLLGMFLFARYRDRLQSEARTKWWERAEAQVAEIRRNAIAGSAITDGPGHDFKKNLVALGLAGSPEARAAALEQLERPGVVVARADGTTLFRAAMGIPIEPASHRDLWLGRRQRQALEDHIQQVDSRLENRSPQPLIEVAGSDGTALHLRYRGEPVTLTAAPPKLEAALDPVVAALMVSATWKLISTVTPTIRAPRLASLTAVGIDVATMVLHTRARTAGRDARFTETAAGAAVASTVFSLGVFRARVPTTAPNGDEIVVATAAAMGLLGVIGSARDQVDDRTAWAGIGVAIAGWLVATARNRPTPGTAFIEAVSSWQAYATSKGLTSSLMNESAHLEAGLHATFQARVRDARREAVRAELDRYRAQVDLAERELGRLRQDLDPEQVQFIEAQCQEVRAWLDRPQTAETFVF